jgi:hypothetical protein
MQHFCFSGFSCCHAFQVFLVSHDLPASLPRRGRTNQEIKLTNKKRTLPKHADLRIRLSEMWPCF